MGLELIKFINSDLTWKAVKKGHRNTKRRPRRPGARSSEIGLGLGNKMQDSFVFDYEKSGVAVLGQHFAEEVLDVPIKKRILLLQSPFLSGEGTRSPEPQTSSPHQELELLVGTKHASGQQCHPNSPSNIWAMKSKNGLINSEHLKLTEKEVSDLNDFSGIELLAAAACCSSVYDRSGLMESFAMEDHTTPRVDSNTDGIKENIAPVESDDSSVQDSTFPATQNLCDNENEGSDKRAVPSKGVRLHWDLNTVMDEWEEPCCDILVDPHSEKSCLKDVYDDSLRNAKANLEGSETGISQVTGHANQFGKHDAAVSVVPLSKPEISGLQENNDGDSFGNTYLASSRKVVEAITCKTSDAESCLSKSDVVDSFMHPAKCENFSTSTASVSLGETTIKVESNTLHDLPMYFEPSSKSAVSEVVQGGSLSQKGDGDDKLISEDRLSDCCVSNVSQDERGHMAEGNTVEKVKAGYDSPVEDGELREPIRYQNEVEERECVDYESDNIYEDNFETIESAKNKISIERHQIIEDGRFAVPNNDIEQGHKADASKRPNHLLGSKASGYQVHEHSQCAIVEGKDGSPEKFLSGRKKAHDEFPGASMLCIDRSTSFGMRQNGASIRRSRSDNIGDSFSRAERDFGPEKFMGRGGVSYQGHARNDASGQWGDSSVGGWDSRNSHGYPRPKNVIGGSAARSGDEHINYNPRGVCRSFNARPSPSDRNESYGIRRGTPPARGINHDRCRGGSGFHLQGLRRAPQEEYHDLEPSYSERKVRCFSSNINRGAHISRSRRRSRSRSRSGSPIAWHFQKKRNVDSKRQSPDYRPDVRIQGERLSLRKISSSSEIDAGLFSPTRGRMSPQCISRSFDDRNSINGQFRDRRSSPVRTFHRNQKFEAGGYLGRLKSNDHFRPTPRPGRFQQLGPNREKFEANGNDSMIHDDKYGMMNGGRRCRYDVDESFKTRNPRNIDNGFRYARNENRCFKDSVERDTAPLSVGEGDFRKNDLQRER
ncbi:uncharacterized protein LOC112508747 [Cynara cardunculus var. scolymus]|uniref:Uncharacterized protein n=1 Tax=Cynara cardunculus var. scolymus TaxID=59895 RepID=A0A103YDK2_CYNCS|nr:uncharacterized protein LOC112508747 [Cynara cardunculus var. scolymus]XP_024969244.1 uncharacterized protein LOC112508747 [Cynara cardunculus var. scolymus]KVI07134.1 hypothetical protein Ccrd_014508 [Cynara cardunculus var. scolymus]